MAELIWRPARPCDLETIASWVDSARALERWAGPGLTWPIKAAALFEQLGGNELPSFCLTQDDLPVAFGQLFVKGDKRLHLARIIVSPAHRGIGLGRQLCHRLLEEARSRHATHITLNVFADNQAALVLYRRLGFVPAGKPDARGVLPMRLPAFAGTADNTDNGPSDNG